MHDQARLRLRPYRVHEVSYIDSLDVAGSIGVDDDRFSIFVPRGHEARCVCVDRLPVVLGIHHRDPRECLTSDRGRDVRDLDRTGHVVQEDQQENDCYDREDDAERDS